MDGTAALAGIDPLDLPPDRFLSWALAWFHARMDEKGRRAFDMVLSRPIPGLDPPPEWSDEAMTESFNAFASEFGSVRT